MSQQTAEEKEIPRSRIYIELQELSSKQRGAVLGIVKDIGFSPAEVKEVVVQLPEDIEGGTPDEKRREKRKRV